MKCTRPSGTRVAAAVIALSVSAVCGGASLPAAAAASVTGKVGTGVVIQTERFTLWDEQTDPAAVTYNEELVPVGARTHVVAVYTPTGDTRVVLSVQGLVPNRTYGVHVHTDQCGATGDAAGPHYQNVPDPTPSGDPEFANPDNEVWLDFTTNADGTARSTAQVPWQFRPDGANSVVIHEHKTSTERGTAGDAGDRLACVTVPF